MGYGIGYDNGDGNGDGYGNEYGNGYGDDGPVFKAFFSGELSAFVSLAAGAISIAVPLCARR